MLATVLKGELATKQSIFIMRAFKEMRQEFHRLKEQENDVKKIEWNAKRFLTKNNYLIQTDAVKNYLIPSGNYREVIR